METGFAKHGFGPVIDPRSEILILGSFPSVKSRETGFFYMHPQNRFWPLLSKIFSEDFTGADREEKIRLLSKHGIALYDVVESCTLQGSADQSISHVLPADIPAMIRGTDISRILLNGKVAARLFKKHFPDLETMAVVLPSTSSANAGYPFSTLLSIWSAFLVESSEHWKKRIQEK